MQDRGADRTVDVTSPHEERGHGQRPGLHLQQDNDGGGDCEPLLGEERSLAVRTVFVRFDPARPLGFTLSPDGGVTVISVESDSPAHAAGVRVGHRVATINGERVDGQVATLMRTVGDATLFTVEFEIPDAATPVSKRLIVLITIAASVYLLDQCVLLVYNKKTLTAVHYPLAMTCVQLLCVSLLLGVVSIGKHYLWDSRQAETRGHSWGLGPHLLWKLRMVSLVGFFFGIKGGITNWGLQLVPATVHTLLNATDIVWAALAARFINKESFTWAAIGSVVLATVGAFLVAVAAHLSEEDTRPGARAFGIVVNLLGPFIGGLTVSTLGIAVHRTMHSESSRVVGMTSIELAALKLLLAGLTLIPVSCIMEGYVAQHPISGSGKKVIEPFWSAFADYDAVLWLRIGGGVLILIVLHVSITWLMALTSPASVALISGVKVVPQWLFSLAFALKVNVSPLNITGAVLVCISSALWALLKYVQRKKATPLSPSDVRQYKN